MSEKICPKCGMTYGDSSAFCRQCGTKLIAFEVKTEAEERPKENDAVVFNESYDSSPKPKLKQIKSSDTETAVRTLPRTSYETVSRPKPNSYPYSDKEQTMEFSIYEEMQKRQQNGNDSFINHMPTRECPRCGAIIPADSRFCPACKEELSDNYFADDDDDGQKRNLRTPILIICSVAAVILLTVLLVSALSKDGPESESSLQSSLAESSQESSEESSEEQLFYSEPEEDSYDEPEYSEYSEYSEESSEEFDESSEEESLEESSEESDFESSDSESSDEESFDESDFENSEYYFWENSDFEISDFDISDFEVSDSDTDSYIESIPSESSFSVFIDPSYSF